MRGEEEGIAVQRAWTTVNEEPSIKLVACPCCRAPLYSLEWNRDTSKWQPAKDSRPLRYDADGAYMACQRCASRIAMVEAPAYAEEPSFIAARQNCKRCVAQTLKL